MAATPQITLFQYPGITQETTLSAPCGKVHMALRFKGLTYQVHNLTSLAQTKRINPRGRVPVLKIGDATFVDSTDIVTEIDRRFPDPPLQPEPARARALAKILEDWADEVLYFYGLYLRFGVPANFERIRKTIFARLPIPARWLAPAIVRRDLNRRAAGQGVALKGEAVVRRELFECYDTLEELLREGPFTVGQRLTRADLALASVVDQHRLRELTPDLREQLDTLPRVNAWLERVHAVAPSAA